MISTIRIDCEATHESYFRTIHPDPLKNTPKIACEHSACESARIQSLIECCLTIMLLYISRLYIQSGPAWPNVPARVWNRGACVYVCVCLCAVHKELHTRTHSHTEHTHTRLCWQTVSERATSAAIGINSAAAAAAGSPRVVVAQDDRPSIFWLRHYSVAKPIGAHA